jgi:hypothetical protein
MLLIVIIYTSYAGENNCNSGDGTGQMAQPWMFMMMMMMTNYAVYSYTVY